MHWFLRGRQTTWDGTLPVNHKHTATALKPLTAAWIILILSTQCSSLVETWPWCQSCKQSCRPWLSSPKIFPGFTRGHLLGKIPSADWDVSIDLVKLRFWRFTSSALFQCCCELTLKMILWSLPSVGGFCSDQYSLILHLFWCCDYPTVALEHTIPQSVCLRIYIVSYT